MRIGGLLATTVLIHLWLVGQMMSWLHASDIEKSSFPERFGEKPFDAFWKDKSLLSPNRFYFDPSYGTPVFRLDDAPVADFSYTSGIYEPWNSDGSLLFMRSFRPLGTGDEVHRGFVFEADFGRMHPVDVKGRQPFWHPGNPDTFFDHTPGRLEEVNALGGGRKLIAEWPAGQGEKLIDAAGQGTKIFLDAPGYGIWLPLDDYDSAVGAGVEGLSRSPKGPTGEIEFREAGNSEEDRFFIGPLPGRFGEGSEWWIQLRTGLLIDYESGDVRRVILPGYPNSAYLEAYSSGNVRFPDRAGWEAFSVIGNQSPEAAKEAYLAFPEYTHGHWMTSPDGRYRVSDHWKGNGYYKEDLLAGTPMELQRVGEGSSVYHVYFSEDPRFFVGTVQGHSWRTYATRERGNEVIQFFMDGTFQPIVNLEQEPYGTYLGAGFPILSRNRKFKNHVAVVALPEAPREVRTYGMEGVHKLEWLPPAKSKEIAGYLVYRSGRSGGPYQLVSEGVIDSTNWTESEDEAGSEAFYVVTAVEHSGSESNFSAEVHLGGEPGQRTLFLEPERSLNDDWRRWENQLSLGVDRMAASGWNYVYRHPSAVEPPILALEFPEVSEGEYAVWLRVRKVGTSGLPGSLTIFPGSANAQRIEVVSEEW